jgi:CheY-like chemotaxis protein
MGSLPRRRRTVLVVDDEPDVREVLRHLLEELYTVEEAGSGAEAIRLVHALHPDLVLLDQDAGPGRVDRA